MTAGDGFLSRWSQRKARARDGAVAVDLPAAPELDPVSGEPGRATAAVAPTLPMSAETAPPGVAPTSGASAPEPPPLPTLDDVAALTHASDYSPFVARGVDAGVRNAAMKKLFSDPHFNVMDGLDTYIDDYGKSDPIPLSMLRRMNQAVALGLFAEEAAPATAQAPAPLLSAEASPDGAAPSAMAQSTVTAARPPVPEAPDDDDADLQLQPDDADRRAGAAPGPEG